MSREVDVFLSKCKAWRKEIEKLRGIAVGFPMTEELKWGKPCYTFEGRNVIILQGFKEFCAILFPKGALLKDPHHVLEKPGENTQAARRIPFRDVNEITGMEKVLRAYIREAMEAERAGMKVKFKTRPEAIVPELQAKLDAVPAFKAAFHALTPGRQRAYHLYFSAPKQSMTRQSRVDKSTARILEGKGLNDR